MRRPAWSDHDDKIRPSVPSQFDERRRFIGSEQSTPVGGTINRLVHNGGKSRFRPDRSLVPSGRCLVRHPSPELSCALLRDSSRATTAGHTGLPSYPETRQWCPRVVYLGRSTKIVRPALAARRLQGITMFLLRHGQSYFNLLFTETRVDPGIEDPELTPLGIAQAQAAAKGLAEVALTRIIVSPYTRALQDRATPTGGSSSPRAHHARGPRAGGIRLRYRQSAASAGRPVSTP